MYERLRDGGRAYGRGELRPCDRLIWDPQFFIFPCLFHDKSTTKPNLQNPHSALSLLPCTLSHSDDPHIRPPPHHHLVHPQLPAKPRREGALLPCPDPRREGKGDEAWAFLRRWQRHAVAAKLRRSSDAFQRLWVRIELCEMEARDPQDRQGLRYVSVKVELIYDRLVIICFGLFILGRPQCICLCRGVKL